MSLKGVELYARDGDGNPVALTVNEAGQLVVEAGSVTVESLSVANPMPISVASGADVSVGATNATAWDGVAANATLVALLKAIHVQNAAIIVLLDDIKTNTTPA